jgi:hypothetical protein
LSVDVKNLGKSKDEIGFLIRRNASEMLVGPDRQSTFFVQNTRA